MDDAQKAYIDLVNSMAGSDASEPAGADDRYQGLKITTDKKVFRIQLNRPSKKNALTWQATFHTPFSQLGQSPEGCSSYLFPKMMGNAKAGELLLFNKKITAHEACERNLVTQGFPEGVFQKETEALVSYYGSLPPQSLKYSKTLNRSAERELLHKVNEAECDLLVERWQSQECINAIMSFFSRKANL